LNLTVHLVKHPRNLKTNHTDHATRVYRGLAGKVLYILDHGTKELGGSLGQLGPCHFITKESTHNKKLLEKSCRIK
jgi:hypothetical protein